jgi:hypothetical protein
MTTHYRTEEVPATTRRIETHTTCDLCGGTIKNASYGDYDECTIARRSGARYGGEGNHEETSMDMCGECFETKLTPWLESQGVKMQKADQDY